MKSLLLIIAFISFSQISLGQMIKPTRVVRLPEENGVVAIVNQPTCPVKIVVAEILTKEDGAYPILRYVLQNNSRKSIKYFSVAFAEKFTIEKWHSFGSGHEESVGSVDGKGPILLDRGKFYSNWPAREFEIVPSTESVNKLLVTKPGEQKLKFIGLGMITKVTFSDGSSFDGTPPSSELYDLFMTESVDYLLRISK